MLSIGMSAAEDEEMMTIVETAAEENFSTLVTAVDAAGLTETLNGEGPFTVFAPTDEAFAGVDIDMNDTDSLADILKYHVASGEYMEADVVNMTEIETLEGGELSVEVTDAGVMVGGANVTATDIVCSNGVIHVIDAVLMPLDEELTMEVEETVEEVVGEIQDIGDDNDTGLI
ncbi:MAG: fasciclin domain-containing protein [Methanocrinis sp.]